MPISLHRVLCSGFQVASEHDSPLDGFKVWGFGYSIRGPLNSSGLLYGWGGLDKDPLQGVLTFQKTLPFRGNLQYLA